MKPRVHNYIKYKTRRKVLRNNPTKSEYFLWQKIRNSQLGYKFRRQQSIGNYIVDFYCPELNIIVELDGYIHGEQIKKEQDKRRQIFLEGKGFMVLRYRNEQIMYELESVVQDIKNKCQNISLPINHKLLPLGKGE